MTRVIAQPTPTHAELCVTVTVPELDVTRYLSVASVRKLPGPLEQEVAALCDIDFALDSVFGDFPQLDPVLFTSRTDSSK